MEEDNNGLTQQLEQASTSKSAAVEELAKKKDEVDHLTEELQVAHKRIEIVEADVERVNKQLQVRSAIVYIHQFAQHNLCFLLIFLVLLYMHQQIMHQQKNVLFVALLWPDWLNACLASFVSAL